MFGATRLAEHAQALAREQKLLPYVEPGWLKRRERGPLLSRLDATEKALTEAQDAIAKCARDGVDVSPAAAWLLDNFFVVLEQVPEIRATLPPGYYQELPKLESTDRYPRIYAIIEELIWHTDGRLDEGTVALMIREYQRVTPLTMGELWAIPAMLRLGYLENVRRMSIRAARDMSDRALADEWVTRVLTKASGNAEAGLSELVHLGPRMTPAFLTRFLQQVRSRQVDFTPLLWLEQWIAEDVMSVEEASQRSAQELALTQLVMANSIASMRTVVSVDWTAFVESASVTEAILRKDPAQAYAGMTRATRDQYRHAIERLARRSKRDEPDVAQRALDAAAMHASDAREGHVGYYLVGDGARAFARSLGYVAQFRSRIIDAVLAGPGAFYFGSILIAGVVVLAILLTPMRAAHASMAWWLLGVALVLMPASDVAISLVHQVINILIPPRRLARLDFDKGVPSSERTAVVVPLLFSSVQGVEQALDHIEVIYLANRDKEVRFAILSDFTDSATETTPADDTIIAAAVEGIRALNDAYRGEAQIFDSPFYLLHRARKWNAVDSIWMGWERKRGKLEQFNEFVSGANDDAFSVREGNIEWLRTVRFVITLDADTILPRGAAASLIGTLAHPLNRAEYDEARRKVVRGYGILQPRVSVSLASASESRFASVYSGHPGVDPYTTAVSDVYQDLFGSGTFTGKGIYDLDVFRKATAGRFPENALLSHDLIEGSFARAGLVSDIEVYDDYPTRYLTATRRTHRWIRGDWQLLPWLGRNVPSTTGPARNPLTGLSRWKMFDNLRRSVTPLVVLLWLVAGWTVLPGSGSTWTVLTFAAFGFPWIAPLILSALRPPSDQSWGPFYSALGSDAVRGLQQLGLAIILLPDQALLAFDAIGRTLTRLYITHKHLLEWQPALHVETTTVNTRASVWRRMRNSVGLAIVILAVTTPFAFRALNSGGGDGIVIAAFIGVALIWVLAPEMALALSKPLLRRDLVLGDDDRALAARYAALHWKYFDTFVTAGTNWLVPDNFQETPEPVVAPRTSPTNIGLQLLSTMSAHDLGLITSEDMLERMENTFGTLDRMQRIRGHFFNWYDTSDLRVLDPPYVSSVDSGNFAGHLMALAQGLLAYAEKGRSFAALHVTRPETHGSAAVELARTNEGKARVFRMQTLAERARLLAMEMDFRLLYDVKRRLFSIGYDARSGKLDESSYDLLASEARLMSFVAIAKGDANVEHWFRLSRSLTVADGSTALVSWSGSMFEYLMPLLVMPPRPFSLLDQTCHAAVDRQRRYGKAKEIPWGISESAYNVRDRHETYQYRAFGVPDLALKRGLANDLVVAPYATALATSVDAHRAFENLQALERAGAIGAYGFYDALDFTRANSDQSPAIVRNYMAHHVGMSLVAMNNALSIRDDESISIWQQRFMDDAAVRATALLLDERVPRRYVPRAAQDDGVTDPVELMPRMQISVHEVDSPDTPQPHVALLGGNGYNVLLTNAGSGHSSAGGNDVYRWRADQTQEDTGHWIYVRDLTGDTLWSVAHQPVRAPTNYYRASFASDRVAFTRRDGPIETRTEVVVITSEQAEIRRVTLVNRSHAVREIELTSYGEVVLCPAAADRAHPAFQKLFVQTEWVPKATLLASRRPRSSEESWPWCVHVVAAGSERVGDISYETDRAQFVGRGRTVHSPRALDAGVALSGGVGAVLDPVVALRVKIRIEPGRSATVAFTTAVAPTREAALMLADRYRNINASERALALARTEAQVELRDLDIEPNDVALYQQLAGALIYPHEALRAPESERAKVKRGQSALWSQSISGDWPIVLATIRGEEGISSIRQLLLAHRYWRTKGIRSDLVILNEKPHSYIQELHDQIMMMTMSSTEGGSIDKPGGVFIKRSDALSADDIALLKTTARIHIICDGIGLGEIVASNIQEHRSRQPRRVSASFAIPLFETTTPSRSSGDMPVIPANGYGALSKENAYAIRVSGSRVPPAPWANVIANPNIGFCITERGGGFTWVENSYFYRLTPWFNDPVSDPSGEIVYLRDLDTNQVWSPTPAPWSACDNDREAAYETVHAPGVTTFSHERDGISTHLVLGVPAADTVKISRLTLTNNSTASRRISLTSYVEWVLGAEREHTRHQLHTRRDDVSGGLFAQNFYAPDFDGRVAFAWISEAVTSYTCRRDDFIGRNRDLTTPVGLDDDELTGASGAGYDPCAALRCAIALAPGESREVVILLGAGRSDDDARSLISRYGVREYAESTVGVAIGAWKDRLSVITCVTPDPEFDALLNHWSLYQALACRMWARSALYQSSGAYGFRDQLQDCMAFVYSSPAIAREHILRSAGHQFLEGDVQHWWHEPSGRGVRTRFSDDLGWLPFVTDHYVRVTADTGIWDAEAPYLTMRLLNDGEQETYDLPQPSGKSGALYEHCVKALDRACTQGVHGLPLMGAGDWNDGMNRVGVGGKGESVWLAWFLAATLRRFASHADSRGDADVAGRCRSRADAYAAAVEASSWDGAWYRRAYYDDGTPLGSSANDECRIDAIAQSWSVISGAGDPARAKMAMQSVNTHLVKEDARQILLLTPPFDKTTHDPGYIKGYLPGVRENGAQYTHAALWTTLAMARLGDGERAHALLRMLNPFTHAETREQADTYMVEPYVVAADVYAGAGHEGRGGWTWYTGSASWSYRVALEGILGFEKRGDVLHIDPCIPPSWPQFSIVYRHGSSLYSITVQNPEGVTRGVRSITVDGLEADAITLRDDGAPHAATIVLGST